MSCEMGIHLCSRFGRRPVLFIFLVFHGVAALVQAISVNWIMFCILNWTKGMSQTYSVSIILGETNMVAICQQRSEGNNISTTQRVCVFACVYVCLHSCDV